MKLNVLITSYAFKIQQGDLIRGRGVPVRAVQRECSAELESNLAPASPFIPQPWNGSDSAMKLMFGMNVGGILIKAISSVSFHPDRPLLTYPHASSTTPPPPPRSLAASTSNISDIIGFCWRRLRFADYSLLSLWRWQAFVQHFCFSPGGGVKTSLEFNFHKRQTLPSHGAVNEQ